MGAIFKREFKSYMTNMYGSVFIFFMLLITGLFFFLSNLVYGGPQIEYDMLFYSSMILIIAIPILTMRSVAEDKHNGTDKFLLSLPLKVSGIVAGKYLALLAVFAIPTAVMCLLPIILSLFGEVYFLTSYSSLLAFFLLGAALLAICMYISSLTENQIISAVISLVTILVLFFLPDLSVFIPSTPLASYISIVVLEAIVALIAYFLTRSVGISLTAAAIMIIPTSAIYIFASSLFEGLFAKIVAFLSPFTRFFYFTYGIFDLSSIVYYLSLIAFFIFLTMQSLDKKRWG